MYGQKYCTLLSCTCTDNPNKSKKLNSLFDSHILFGYREQSTTEIICIRVLRSQFYQVLIVLFNFRKQWYLNKMKSFSIFFGWNTIDRYFWRIITFNRVSKWHLWIQFHVIWFDNRKYLTEDTLPFIGIHTLCTWKLNKKSELGEPNKKCNWTLNWKQIWKTALEWKSIK